MIVQTKNGIMLHGEIAKDPVLRDAGQKRVLKFDLKASRTQDETGKWQSFFVGVSGMACCRKAIRSRFLLKS